MTPTQKQGGMRAWEGRFGRRTTKTETSRDDEHEEDVVTRLKFEMLCDGSPEAMIISDDRGEGKRGGSFTDETIMDGAKTTATTELGMRQ